MVAAANPWPSGFAWPDAPLSHVVWPITAVVVYAAVIGGLVAAVKDKPARTLVLATKVGENRF